MTTSDDKSIANQTPDASQPFPRVTIAPAAPLTNPPQPKSEQVRRALQWAAWNIRKKNRAGRPPL